MRSNQKVLAGRQIVCLFAAFFLVGCNGLQLFVPHRVDTQPEAGAVNLSVTLVAPWEDYIATLQPKFDLPADKALAKVIPKTTELEEKLLDALGLKARIGLLQPGELPQEAAVQPLPKEDSSALPSIQEKDKSITKEPMLEYAAGAALYQEGCRVKHRLAEDEVGDSTSVGLQHQSWRLFCACWETFVEDQTKDEAAAWSSDVSLVVLFTES